MDLKPDFLLIGGDATRDGAIHRWKVEEMKADIDGIHFDLAPGIAMGQWSDRWPDGDASPGFLEYAVSGKRIEKRFVSLEHESTRTDGYGPGGHPLPETRDCALPWENGGEF